MGAEPLDLARIAEAVAGQPTVRAAARLLVEQLFASFGCRCAIVCNRGNICLPQAGAPAGSAPPLAEHPGTRGFKLFETPDGEWRLVLDTTPDDPRRDLEGAVVVLGQALQVAWYAEAERRRCRRERQLYRLALRLLRTTEPSALHQAIVERMAAAVDADTGSLAIYRRREDALVIAATYGYPSVLVDHLRIRPGEGVIGRVFTSGRAVCERVSPEGTDSPRRRRYRGDSYVAVPLGGPDGPLGVVSVTDRRSEGPFDRSDLAILREYAVAAAFALSRDALRDHTSNLAHLASVDELTGISNRRHFDERLDAEIQRGRREGGSLALLMIDVDDFKLLNDSRGHLYGDRVLRELGDILKRSVRSFDVCARYGGEEFVILMPGASAPIAVQIAERIRRHTESHFADSWRFAGPGRPTLSIGVSTLGPDMTGEALVASADAALLWAKASGKNTVKLDERSVAR